MFASALVLLAGLAALTLALWDAVATTLWTTTAGGPLTSRLTGWCWRGAHRLARRPSSPILASAGPLLLIVTVGTWLLLLWVGWTLVFSAAPTAVVSSTTGEPAGWVQRAYFAGSTSFTLGIGDYVPTSGPWQFATVIATLSGLGLTTLSITYLLPVVSAVTDVRTQAATIAGLGTDPHDIVSNAYHDGSVRLLEPIILDLTQGLLLTAERQLSYPILHYFHPSSPRVDLRVQLAVLDDALVFVDHGLAGEVTRPHPAAIVGLRAAMDQLIERAASATTREPVPPLQLHSLREAGLPVVDDASFAERCERLAEHRGRVSGYASESKWRRRS